MDDLNSKTVDMLSVGHLGLGFENSPERRTCFKADFIEFALLKKNIEGIFSC